MDLIVAISAATKALEGLKLLKEIGKSFDEANFKLKIADISSDVAELKIALTDAKTLLADKDAEISKLRQNFAFKAEHTTSVRGLTLLS